ncbi:MAG: hypothetical protein HY001_04350 [Candidatus Portnoybacteria bacterium]|nr:hypothetical protein [Candidatus Portnoybacteria bacterium]
MSYEARIFWLIVCIILAGIAGYYIFFLRVYLVVLGLLFFLIGAVYFIKYHRLWPKIIEEKYAHIEAKKVEPTPAFSERWEPVRQAIKSIDLHELRVRVIDADTLVEELLRLQGIEGDTMASLIAEAGFRGIVGTEALSRFHRLRNRIVHESAFTPSTQELQQSLKMLDGVLVRWGVLLPPEV